MQCYLSKLEPQPDRTKTIWAEKTTGAIYNCWANWRATMWVWIDDPNRPDAGALARRAVDQMKLQGIRIAMIPQPIEVRPKQVGVVGQPVWMWAESPDATTWGPKTVTATEGAYSITATAKANRVKWAMGDGKTVTCWGPGTKWERWRSYSNEKSPDCGYLYEKQGSYTVTATTYWTISWAGMGTSGTIPMQLSSSVHNTIGEIQVLNVPNPTPRR